MMKMNPEVKEKWVKALRSGEYKQGREYLRKDDKYCCLGVLCDIYSKAKNTKWVQRHYIEGCTVHLPPEVFIWAGLAEPSPQVSETYLVNHNDGWEGKKPKSFKQIARLIEKHL